MIKTLEYEQALSNEQVGGSVSEVNLTSILADYITEIYKRETLSRNPGTYTPLNTVVERERSLNQKLRNLGK